MTDSEPEREARLKIERREARLKMALRDNLRKRKEQARAAPGRAPEEPTGE